jgi:hypothetical protein
LTTVSRVFVTRSGPWSVRSFGNARTVKALGQSGKKASERSS